MNTLKEMAQKAGFDARASTAQHREIHWPGIYANIDGRDDITEQLQRFASLVAERCAEISTGYVWFEHENDQPDSGNTSIAALIRAEFPKP